MGKRAKPDPVDAELPLAKYFASSEKPFLLKSAREDGLDMRDAELAKLWKDKPLVQQALAQELAELVLHVAGIATNEEHAEESDAVDGDKPLQVKKARARALTALDFYDGFWMTIASEWHGVDKFRVNKYYLLMRRYVEAGFRLLLLHKWDSVLVKKFTSVMRGLHGPLSSNNVGMPDSITYHVCDIYLDELEQVVSSADEPGRVPISGLLLPLLELAATSRSKRVYDRVMSSAINPFLDATRLDNRKKKRRRVAEASHGDDVCRFASIFAHMHADVDDGDEHDDEEDDAELDEDARRILSIRRQTIKHAFTIASSPDAYVPSRRALYALWQSEQRT
ncbi:hypothetical protein MVES_000074 [Malassezia vespertilionis]|uniref:Nop52-domain-containing protein n=1 Tax=Malassezia vespertilionis TaxID=2020962 RepID=A0A2N1JG73_9BASI|nr:hypothetical protein MVES_000074 [Malassezia vespertilionis]